MTGPGTRLLPAKVGPVLRRHWLFITLVVFGVVVRGATIAAYGPALVTPDTLAYWTSAHNFEPQPLRPIGYSFFLAPVAAVTDSLTPVQVMQHSIGLLLAGGLYAFLLRRGLPAWGSALSTAPVLLDPLQIVLEHYVLTDVLFEGLLVLACLLLLWRHRPHLWQIVAVGTLVGTAGLVRGAGTLLVVVFALALVCLRAGWSRILVFVVAAAIPVGAYMVAFHAEHGEYAVTTGGPRFLYARLAPLVRCDDPQLRIPPYARQLCPRIPVAERPSSNYYMWGQRWGQVLPRDLPPGVTREEVLRDFDKQVVRAQPVVFAEASLKDFLAGFSPSRAYAAPGRDSAHWRFQEQYDQSGGRAWELLGQRGWDVEVNESAARPLTTYGRWANLPGPLAGALAMAAVLAALGVGRSRWSGDRVAIGLLAGACLTTMVTGAALAGFSWRYQLPQLAMLPAAGALAVAALARGAVPGKPAPLPPLRILDRAASRLARVPMPQLWRRRASAWEERGVLAVALGVLAGIATAAVVEVAAVQSGWFTPGTAAVGATVAGGLVSLVLLVSRRRARSLPPRPGDGDTARPRAADSTLTGTY